MTFTWVEIGHIRKQRPRSQFSNFNCTPPHQKKKNKKEKKKQQSNRGEDLLNIYTYIRSSSIFFIFFILSKEDIHKSSFYLMAMWHNKKEH